MGIKTDFTTYSTSLQQRIVCGIDDRIDFERCDVVAKNVNNCQIGTRGQP